MPVPASTAQGTISGLFKAQTGGKEPADRAIARLFYVHAIPFNVADSKYFKEAVKAVAACGPTYIPPAKLLGRLPKVDLIILEGGKCPSVRPQKVSSI